MCSHFSSWTFSPFKLYTLKHSCHFFSFLTISINGSCFYHHSCDKSVNVYRLVFLQFSSLKWVAFILFSLTFHFNLLNSSYFFSCLHIFAPLSCFKFNHFIQSQPQPTLLVPSELFYFLSTFRCFHFLNISLTNTLYLLWNRLFCIYSSRNSLLNFPLFDFPFFRFNVDGWHYNKVLLLLMS